MVAATASNPPRDVRQRGPPWRNTPARPRRSSICGPLEGGRSPEWTCRTLVASVALLLRDGDGPRLARHARDFRHGLRTIAAMVRLHPRLFAIAVCGAAVFAVATVASSWALGWVTDEVIVPRFEEGEVAAAPWPSASAWSSASGWSRPAASSCGASPPPSPAPHPGDPAPAGGRRYQEVPYRFHRRTPTGELLSHAGNDVDAAAEVLNPLPYSTGVLVIVVLSVAWMLATDLWLAMVAFIVFPALVILNVKYQRAIGGPAEAAQEQLGHVSAVAHESFDGALVVKALGAEAIESARFRTSADTLRDAKVHGRHHPGGLRGGARRPPGPRHPDAAAGRGLAGLGGSGHHRHDRLVRRPVPAPRVPAAADRLRARRAAPLVVGHDRIQRVLAEPADPRHATASTGRSPLGRRPAGGHVAWPSPTSRRCRCSPTCPSRSSRPHGGRRRATGSGKSTLAAADRRPARARLAAPSASTAADSPTSASTSFQSRGRHRLPGGVPVRRHRRRERPAGLARRGPRAGARPWRAPMGSSGARRRHRRRGGRAGLHPVGRAAAAARPRPGAGAPAPTAAARRRHLRRRPHHRGPHPLRPGASWPAPPR